MTRPQNSLVSESQESFLISLSSKRSEPQGSCYKPLFCGSSWALGLEGEGSNRSSVSKGATVENFFPAEGLLVALGGFSLGFLVALGGFSFGFLVGLVEPSRGFVALGPLSFFPFFSLSLFFSGGTVKDEDAGADNQSLICVPTWSPWMPRAWV